MSKKAKGSQLGLFHEAEGLPIFSGAAYGPRDGVGAFVQHEAPKQAAMFAATFDELARAEQAKKAKKAKQPAVCGCSQPHDKKSMTFQEFDKGMKELDQASQKERARVMEDARVNVTLYKGIAVVYQVDHSFGWAYLKAPNGSLPVCVFVHGVEWAFIHRGDGSVELLGEVVNMDQCTNDHEAGEDTEPLFDTSAGLVGFDRLVYDQAGGRWYLPKVKASWA